MAAITYKLNPTTPSTFGSTDLEGAESFTINAVADETLLQTDGKPFVLDAFYDNLSYTVSVQGVKTIKTFKIGDVNTLTLRASQRATGEGVDGSGVLTFTTGTDCAVVSSYDSTVNHAGNASYTVNFRIVAAANTVGISDPVVVS